MSERSLLELLADMAAVVEENPGKAIRLAADEIKKLRAENEKLKAELRSIDGALDDPRTNLTLTTAEVIWELKAELAEAKKDAMCWHMTRQWHSVETLVRIEQSASESMKGK